MSEHPSEVDQDEDRLDMGVPMDEQDIPLARRHPELPDDAFTDLGPADGGGGENWVDIVPEDEEVQGLTAQAQLLAWHYRLGHVSFAKIRKMAARGDLPANLAKCKTPKCAACVYGKFHKRSWRSKAPVNENKIPPATRPGAVIAIDQMISETPGLIAQMSGFITKQRYKVTTVFVDHFSGLSFTNLQKTTNALETVEGKRAFERYARTHGVSVSHYHADNGIFASAQFIKAVEFDGQTISYCAVNAHHQNGKAEKKIRDLQDMARSMLLHAKQRWPSAITSNLWPYAMRMASDVINMSPGLEEDDGLSPMEKFTQVSVSPRIKHSHTFGSPVYVLDSRLQSGRSLPKWRTKARVGIYLGASPRHSPKVALVLNLATGHVSPQFHVTFDDLFETLRPSSGNVLPESNWQLKTGLQAKRASNDRSRKSSALAKDAIHHVGVIPPSEFASVDSDVNLQDPWPDAGTQVGTDAGDTNNEPACQQEEQGDESKPAK
jgi:hypothetical protein